MMSSSRYIHLPFRSHGAPAHPATVTYPLPLSLSLRAFIPTPLSRLFFKFPLSLLSASLILLDSSGDSGAGFWEYQRSLQQRINKKVRLKHIYAQWKAAGGILCSLSACTKKCYVDKTGHMSNYSRNLIAMKSIVVPKLRISLNLFLVKTVRPHHILYSTSGTKEVDGKLS